MSQGVEGEKISNYLRMRRFIWIVGLLALHPSTVVADDHRLKPKLTWTADGGIIVNKRWFVDPDVTAFSALAGCDGEATCAFSASGDRYVVFQRYGGIHDSEYGLGSGFRYARTGGPLSERNPVPEWIQIPDDSLEPDKDALFTDTYFFWLDDRTLHVEQGNNRVGGQTCRFFDTEERRWQPDEEECLDTRSHSIVRVEPGPKGLFAAYSSSEGSPSLDLFQWRVDNGFVDLKFPTAGNYIYGATIHFIDGSDRVEIATQCDFSRTNWYRTPCEGIAEKTPKRRYDWHWDEPATYKLIDEGTMTEVVASPSDPNRIAWPIPGGVCVREAEAEPRCFDLPDR